MRNVIHFFGMSDSTSRGAALVSLVVNSTFWHVLALLFLVFIHTSVNAKALDPVKKEALLFGMSTALSGPAEQLGKNMLLGVNMRFEEENNQGGVNGHPLELVALDDGYEPIRTAPNMRALIEQEQVLAVIGNVGTPTAISAIPIANEKQTLLFAPFTGAGVLRKSPPDRYIINYRASYAEETSTMVEALIKHAGLKPEEIAFFTQRDGYGDAGYIGGITALLKNGLKSKSLVVHGRYERNTLSVDNALADILLAETPPKAIIMVGAYAPCARFIKLAQEAGIKALFLNVSFVGSAPLARQLGDHFSGVIVTQVVPHPSDVSVPIVKQYQDALKAITPDTQASFGSLEGYIAATIMIKALKTIDGKPTRESLIDAVEGLGQFDIGIGKSLFFDTKNHQASHTVWPTRLQGGKFVPFEWADIASFLDL